MSNVLDLNYHAKNSDGNFDYYNEWVKAYMEADIKDIEQHMQLSLGNYFDACRMLSRRGGKEDYELLQKQLNNSDKHKYWCALDCILRFNVGKAKHSYRVDEMLDSEDICELKRAMDMIKQHKLRFDSDRVCKIYEKQADNFTCFCALRYTDGFDGLFERVVNLFKRSNKSQSVCLATLLFEMSNNERFNTIFELLSSHEYHKVRILAVRLAINHERFGLLTRFVNEKDGHIRKLAQKYV